MFILINKFKFHLKVKLQKTSLMQSSIEGYLRLLACEHFFSLFTWRISLWPNCGFWSIVAFYLQSHAWDCGFEWPCWRGGPEIKSQWIVALLCWYGLLVLGPDTYAVRRRAGRYHYKLYAVCHCGMTSVCSFYRNRTQIDQSNYLLLLCCLYANGQDQMQWVMIKGRVLW